MDLLTFVMSAKSVVTERLKAGRTLNRRRNENSDRELYDEAVRALDHVTESLNGLLELIRKGLTGLHLHHDAFLNAEGRNSLRRKFEEIEEQVNSPTSSSIRSLQVDTRELRTLLDVLQREVIQLIQQAGIRFATDEWQDAYVSSEGLTKERELVLVDWDWVGSTKLSERLAVLGLESEARAFMDRAKVSLQACASRYGGVLWISAGDRNIYAFEKQDGRERDEHFANALKCAAEILSLVRAANKIQKVQPDEFILPIRIFVQLLRYEFVPRSLDREELDRVKTSKIIVADIKRLKSSTSNAIVVDDEVYNRCVVNRWPRKHVGWEELYEPISETDKIKLWVLADPGHNTITEYISTDPKHYVISVPAPLAQRPPSA